MLTIRPIAESDIDSLVELVKLTRGALTSLPVERALLEDRVHQSLSAFSEEVDRPAGELYTFVLEDSRKPDFLLGTANVVSKTGGFEPFYCYELREEHYKSDVLKVDRLVRSMHLIEDHSGPAEVGGLFLRPGVRGGGFGRMLSVARFLFIAARPQAFESQVVAEVRGVTDEAGNSPFWDAVGGLFFGVPFGVADALSFKEKKVIADLMPDHPIYIDMLPRSAREVIGVEHDFARPARKLLEGEGFTFRNQVDIFDAGPTMHCDLLDIRAIATSKVAEVTSVASYDDERAETIVSNELLSFRGCPAVVRTTEDGGVELSEAAASALQVQVGQQVRYTPLRPEAGLSRSDEVDLYQSIPLPAES